MSRRSTRRSTKTTTTTAAAAATATRSANATAKAKALTYVDTLRRIQRLSKPELVSYFGGMKGHVGSPGDAVGSSSSSANKNARLVDFVIESHRYPDFYNLAEGVLSGAVGVAGILLAIIAAHPVFNLYPLYDNKKFSEQADRTFEDLKEQAQKLKNGHKCTAVMLLVTMCIAGNSATHMRARNQSRKHRQRGFAKALSRKSSSSSSSEKERGRDKKNHKSGVPSRGIGRVIPIITNHTNVRGVLRRADSSDSSDSSDSTDSTDSSDSSDSK
jgi:hypothetical protein